MTSDETIITDINGLIDEGEKKPHVTFIKGPRLGQIHPLDKEEIVVGRSPDCSLWIEDGAISRKHFKFFLKDNKITIQDLGSTNGTYVNGERVQEKELEDGDKIQISQSTILELTYLDETKSLSERKRYEMGVMDPVCNIYNKRYFLDRIREEFSFAKRNKRALSLIMIDIDFFKKINDTYGHLAGDLVLQKICGEITKIIRSDDVFARYGGEEFAILLRDADTKSAFNLAERIKNIIAQLSISYNSQSIKVTISSGITSVNDYMTDYLGLIAEADKYLYDSKKNGRNLVSGPNLKK